MLYLVAAPEPSSPGEDAWFSRAWVSAAEKHSRKWRAKCCEKLASAPGES